MQRNVICIQPACTVRNQRGQRVRTNQLVHDIDIDFLKLFRDIHVPLPAPNAMHNRRQEVAHSVAFDGWFAIKRLLSRAPARGPPESSAPNLSAFHPPQIGMPDVSMTGTRYRRRAPWARRISACHSCRLRCRDLLWGYPAFTSAEPGEEKTLHDNRLPRNA